MLSTRSSRPIRRASRSSSATTPSPTATSPPRSRTARPCSPRTASAPAIGSRSSTSAGWQSTVVILGAARIGAAAALMNVQLKPSELQELVRTAGCSAVGVAGEPYRAALEQAVDGVVLGPTDLVTGGAGTRRRSRTTTSTRSCCSPAAPPGCPRRSPSARARSRPGSSTMMTAPFDPAAPPIVGMMCVPIFHVGGSLGLLGALQSGRTTVIQPRFDAGEWLRLVAQHGSRRRSSCRRCSSASSTTPTSRPPTSAPCRASTTAPPPPPSSWSNARWRPCRTSRSPTSSARPRRSARTPRSRPTTTSRRSGSGRSGARCPASRSASSIR